MQPIDSSRSRDPHHRRVPPSAGDVGDTPRVELGEEFERATSEVRLSAAALLVEARFGELTLASRLLHAGTTDVFTIGPGPHADAPANPAYLGSGWDASHSLITSADGGFALRLTAAMRAELETPVQRLALAADVGHVEAPLALPADACLRVPCGEMTFELRAAEPIAAMPKPWLASGWKEEGRYTLLVGVAMLLLLVVVGSIPSDPRALSLDEIGISHRYVTTRILPPEIPEPPPDKGTTAPGGGGSKPAGGPSGQAGTPKTPKPVGRLAVAGNTPRTAEQAAARVKANPMLVLLDGARGGDLADVLSDQSAMGSDVKTVMGNMRVGDLAEAYGVNGKGLVGTGRGGGGEGEGMIAGNGLETIGDYGRGGKKGPGWGRGVGQLGRRAAIRGPDIIPGQSTVRGSLDKEIIRRIVRRHINEVRYCYDQALALKPTLGGRVVVQFTIAPAGNVIASVLGSSTLGSVPAESCIVNAVKRWEFPKPEGGGLVIVSYPFQLTPAGG